VRERDAETDQKVFALRQQIERRLIEDAKPTKEVIAAVADPASGGAVAGRRRARILHLSDLHFAPNTDW
jgi:hypothetical protein